MEPITVQASTVNVDLYKEDVLKVCTVSTKSTFKKEVVLLSIVTLSAHELSQFSLLQKVVENHIGISTWRSNKIIKETRKSQKKPLEIITTHNYLVITESFYSYGMLPDFLVKRTYERLLTKRTTVLSTLTTGFEIQILTNNDLKSFYIQKKHIKSAEQFVPFDKTFIRPLVELERVPKRLLPDLPFSSNTVTIPLGKHFLNSQKKVGLNKLSKLVIIGGSEQHLMIASLQYYIKALAIAKKRVIIFDLENELNGLISKHTQNTDEALPVTVYQVGRNIQLNICAIETPNGLKSLESKQIYQASVLANILTFASGSRALHTSLPHLQTKFLETMKILPLEGLTLKNIVRSDKFTDSNTEQEFAQTEQLQASLSLYADHSELNYQKFTKEYDVAPSSGVTIFQFPTPLVPIKRASVAFLINLFTQRCDPETVVIITNASQLLTQEYGETEGISPKLYADAIGNSLSQIQRTGCLTLATYSLVRFHPDIQQANNTGIYFRFSNPEDRGWIARRYALTQYMEDPNRFLQSLENEGLLFNENTPYTIDHFIPYTLTPVIMEKMIAKHRFSGIKSEKISREQFITSMTILELLDETDFEKEILLKKLETKGIKNPLVRINEAKTRDYINTRKQGSKQIFSISKKGEDFYQEYQRKIDNLPPSLNSDKDKIVNMRANLKERANNVETCDDSEYQQLVQDIQEFTGGLLNNFFTTQGKTDWDYFKDYLTLLEIDDTADKLLIRRIELLERFYYHYKEFY